MVAAAPVVVVVNADVRTGSNIPFQAGSAIDIAVKFI